MDRTAGTRQVSRNQVLRHSIDTVDRRTDLLQHSVLAMVSAQLIGNRPVQCVVSVTDQHGPAETIRNDTKNIHPGIIPVTFF